MPNELRKQGMCVSPAGVGGIYQQTYVETYANVAFAKLYTTKTPIAAADLLNDPALPFYQEQVPYKWL